MTDKVEEQEASRYPGFTNNSDEEDDRDEQQQQEDQENQQLQPTKSNRETNKLDFVSFPTIPDPELVDKSLLSGILTKTLRKVTNASNLVSSYHANKSPGYAEHLNPSTPPREHNSQQELLPSLDPKKDTLPKPKDVSLYLTSSQNSTLPPSLPTSKIQSPASEIKSFIQPPPPPAAAAPPPAPSLPLPPIDSLTKDKSSLDKLVNSTTIPSRYNSATPPMSTTASDVESDTTTARRIQPSGALSSAIRPNHLIDDTPRVTSDNKTLRISTIHHPRLQTINNSTTSSVINVNALAGEGDATASINDKVASAEVAGITSATASINELTATTSAARKDSISAELPPVFQTKSAPNFNNLPNDIEFSDDSASDNESSHSILSHITSSETPSGSNLNLGSRSSHLPYDLTSLYSESIAKSSPIKAERKNITSSGTIGRSPTISSFHALQNMDRQAKQANVNLSSVLIDNARSLLNTNIGAVASSASSIVTSRSPAKKKKKKPKKPSDNPLKSGGIPKKYWMNDAFVSDCLNCLRPFTAFRRKHHCRFCGQIFCSDCCLFISYNQHKDERNNNSRTRKRPYNDKLRVCKPCYDDVIIYLSDDSSTSESEDEKDEEAILDEDSISEKKNEDEFLVPNHPLSRLRSLSTTSYRESINESSSNKGVQTPNITLDNNHSPTSATRNYNNSTTHSQYVYPDESIKVHPKQAPRMAIPTTRTGESVEIPLLRSSYTSSNMHASPGYGSSFKVSALTPGIHHSHYPQQKSPTHSHSHTSSTQEGAAGGKSWRKNYQHLSPNLAHAELITSRSLDNISGAYTNFIGRKSSFQKFRVQSGSDKDLVRHISRREASAEPGDLPIPTSHFDTDVVPRDDEGYSEDDEDEEIERENEDEDEEDEDERAMSLYAALNYPGHGGYPSTPMSHKPPILPNNLNVAVPTLGEFPSMMVGYPRHKLFMPPANTSNQKTPFSGNTTTSTTNQTHGPTVAFVEDEYPKKDSYRSRERAHASLQRIRSRRQSRATRNVSILTQNSLRLPSVEVSPRSHTMVTTSSSPPISYTNSPAMPNNNISTRSLVNEASDMISSSSMLDSELSPLGPRISSVSTGQIEPLDYLSVDEHSDAVGETIPKVDHEKVYKDHLNVILRQSLLDCDIKENVDRWVSVLQSSLDYINSIKLTDTLDIRQYVKIKKVLGGKIEDTHVIDGMFMTKNVDSKRMSSEIKNPRIALLMFPVEYLKQKQQFISLRIIHAQQSVYITNLVSRLVSLEPDIIVVGDSVCGLAHQLLEEAGITVMSNVKPQVIERISRYTKADIFQSVNDLFFKKGKLGHCDQFTIKRFKYGNMVKTYACFLGCGIPSGFTISLRGGDEDLLNSVKYAAETLLPGYLNSRFEKSLFDNLLITYKDGITNGCLNRINDMLLEIDDENNKEEESKSLEFSLDSTEVVNYVKLFNERKLSLSPSIIYSLPTPLVNVIETYHNYHDYYIKNKLIQSIDSAEDIQDVWLSDLRLSIDMETLPHKEDILSILKYASDCHLKAKMMEYHHRARIWFNCMRYSCYQLYPIFHKNIHVLHSTVSIKHATPCAGPGIVVVDYYTDNDKCLGMFLDQVWSESANSCNECGESLLNHYKTYVHGNAKIDLILERFDHLVQGDNYQGKDRRVMWSYCRICNYATPIVAMSDETYYLSIGKFFELNFYGTGVGVGDATSGCDHEYFQNYVKCFAYNELVIRMEYSNIDNYEIMVPKKRLEFIPDIDVKLKLNAYNSINSKSKKFFESISTRLNRVKLDTFDKAEDGTKKLEQMKEELGQHIETINEKFEKIYSSTPVTNYLGLNVVLQDLQKLGGFWDNEFNEFEKKYLPSENEITRITQFHLRNFLMDKYDEGPKEEVEESSKKQEKNEKKDEEENKNNQSEDNVEQRDSQEHSENINEETKGQQIQQEVVARSESEIGIETEQIENEQQVDSDNETDTEQQINTKPRRVSEDHQSSIPERPSISPKPRSTSDSMFDSKMFPTPRSLYHSTSNISERINKWEQANNGPTSISSSEIPVLQNRGSSGSLSSINIIPSQNKVHHLANYFDKMYYDQISLEFSKHRERELKRKPKVKAQPIFESKPIVEIYNKIEDVVGDDNKKGDVSKVNVEVKASDSQDKESKKEEITDQSQPLQSQVQQQQQQQQQQPALEMPEKQSLLKSLTNFWADRSATLWDPLAYPLEEHEHTFADSDVIVREDEPSSLVAFCLSSNDYKQKIQTAMELNDMAMAGVVSEMTTSSRQGTPNDSENDPEKHEIENNEINNANKKKKMAQFAKIEKKFKKSKAESTKTNLIETILTKKKTNHLKYQFIDGNTNLSCKIFYSEQFEALRKACGANDNFIQSLSRCVKWQSSGGKSGSNFLKTLDNRYIVKELSKSELDSFVSIAPFYFKYISQSMFNTLTTAIAKIFGFYQVEIKNNNTGKTFKMDFLIMENLFYNHKTTRIFDLKGSMRNRHVQQTGKENEVLLDENMIEFIYESPVFVKEQSKKLLRGCLFNDTSFLSAMDVMDYSLVIGIDDQSKKLYIGIIDWLRTFTWDKKVENWVKGSNLIGGNKKGKNPTIITPKQYRTRFREAMERYILEVPDIWYEGSK
ncbi:uncharacterized protein SPAPADRAFT_50162 [Spathaspora passalidarum NRRL Y-27907]|uniref:1-phosphatidylinositol-3-phosphate 5-kinase n=1 Tax=Spathaspora passalidarum (strain NRRL Y-27907 / 11-Y1) TaxID=619300 RepID=G3ALM0_SPAPN|nr:uncharacterized protein SPAPADRAFT_50162 [Spathaspora passalidarum NRRL Y-27907]EGW33263.1 hypothetical protein SPAPADRAFT_50162 [Spathaspora passalidarum NRRL Y-27907]